MRYIRFSPGTRAADTRRTPSQILSSGVANILVPTGKGNPGTLSETANTHASLLQHPVAWTSGADLSNTNKDPTIGPGSLDQRVSLPATMTPFNTTRTDGGHGERAASVPVNSTCIEPQSLWIKASRHLSSAESAILARFHPNADNQDIMATLMGIQTEIEQAMASKRDRAWTVTWRGEDIVVRDIAMKIMQWVDKFKEIGDIAVQYHPGHAILPWAAFRFLLKVV